VANLFGPPTCHTPGSGGRWRHCELC